MKGIMARQGILRLKKEHVVFGAIMYLPLREFLPMRYPKLGGMVTHRSRTMKYVVNLRMPHAVY